MAALTCSVLAGERINVSKMHDDDDSLEARVTRRCNAAGVREQLTDLTPLEESCELILVHLVDL